MSNLTEIHEIIERLQKLPDLIYKQGLLVIEAKATYQSAKFAYDAALAMSFNRATGKNSQERANNALLDEAVTPYRVDLSDKEVALEQAKLRAEYRENEFIALRKVADIKKEEYRTFAGAERFS